MFETLTLVSRDGTRLGLRRWSTPEPCSAMLLVVHGYFEHGGRYAELAEVLAARGIETWALDLRGHGRSEGRRGHVTTFAAYLDDVDAALQASREVLPSTPRFVLGHSMGGLVAYLWAAQRPYARDTHGLVLTNPYLGLALRVPAWKIALAHLLSGLVPTFSLPADLDPSLLSHDEQRNQAYMHDPLIFQSATARWFIETTRAQATVKTTHRLPVPVLFVIGDADGIAHPQTSRDVFARLEAPEKTLNELPGQYHEVLNEPSRADTMAAIAAWLEAHRDR